MPTDESLDLMASKSPQAYGMKMEVLCSFCSILDGLLHYLRNFINNIDSCYVTSLVYSKWYLT